MLVRFLRRGIDRKRSVGWVCLGKRHVRVGAVDGGGRGHEQMLRPELLGAFQNVECAEEVGFDVGTRVLQAVANTSLCGEVDDNVGFGTAEGFGQYFHIFEAAFNGAEPRALQKHLVASTL